MKTALLLILYGCCVSPASAQPGQKDKWLQQYIANDTAPPAGWLVKIKIDSVESFLIKTGQVRVLRRLSQTDFIIMKNLQDESLASPAIVSAFPAGNNWKLSPRLLKMDALLLSNANEIHDFYIQSSGITSLKRMIQMKAAPATVIMYEYENLLQLQTNYAFIRKNILPDESVDFIDVLNRQPVEEVSIAGFDNSVNTINKLQNDYPDLDGKNVVVSVKENKPDAADIDLKGRLIGTTAASNTLSSHATIMSTLIAGGGNSFYTARGVAPGSFISSSSFAVLLPDNDAFYQQYRISVQNHSYGTGIENFYGADAAAYDASVNNNPTLLHVFSGGNAGNQTPADGQYAGIDGFANLTGSFKMAKNIITVGSVDSFGIVSQLSSKGPAYDGRVKPDLVAFGEDGSSGAAALVSGTAMVLQQVYKEQHTGALPDAALVKAVLLNSANDVGNKGIDFSAGYGNLDAYRAALVMKASQFFAGSLAQGQSQTFTLPAPNGIKKIKILLAWTDKPAAANAYTAIVNDLDLTVTHTASGQQWLPWVLNTSTQKDSLQLLPARKRDSLNTIEQITIEDPLAGDYIVTVNGRNIPAGTQKFFIAYQWDNANTFKWTCPSKNDNLLPGKQQVPRWQTNYTGNAIIEYKFADSNNWQLINAAAAVSGNYIKWITPDTNAVALLRMTINGQQYISDSFTISSPLQTGVGFNCPDTALLFWNKISTAGKYSIYKLGAQYMEPYGLTADSSVFINKKIDTAEWYSVAPILAFNKTGIHSQALNYTTQGVDCYLTNFTADLADNTTRLMISLGTLFRVARVVIEKADRNGVYKPLQTFVAPIQMQYSATDNTLTKGVNKYRVRIELTTGIIIYSNTETVNYLAGNNYIIYPNPVSRPQAINIIATNLSNQVLQLYNVVGEKIIEQKMTDISMQIATGKFAKGLYFYIILKDGKTDARGKIIVQ